VNVELLQDPVDMVLHCRELDRERGRDFLVRAALFDQPHDVELPRRQLLFDRGGLALPRERRHPTEQTRGHFGRAENLSALDALDRGCEVLHRGVGCDVGRGPRLGNGDDLAFDLTDGEGDELDLRRCRREGPHGVRPVPPSHASVHEQDIRLDQLENLEGLLDAGRCRDHLEAPITFQGPGQGLPVQAHLTEDQKARRRPCSVPTAVLS
jgi:hypothetical protein